MRKLLGALVVSLLVLAMAQSNNYKPPHQKPGPAADKLIFRAFNADRAPLDLKAGQMDLYLFGLKTAAAQDLRGASNIKLYQAPATSLSLILNPAPAPAGQLNPFSIKEVRQAMQYLVNREFIARDIYRGNAFPMITQVSPRDFDFLAIYDLDRGSGIRYDPERARNVIAEAMKKAGAEPSGGKWSFKGQPIRLKFIARVEDERREIGDLIRAELEKAGFAVGMSYQTFAPAVLSVYSGDPKTLEWNLYTEGWGRGAPQRYDSSAVNSFYAPWLGNMPGWQQAGFWQYKNDELDDVGKKLFRGEFKNEAERNTMYRRMTQLGLDESVRVWLVTAVNNFPSNTQLTGVTEDLVSGPRNPYALREAYIPGKDSITVGNLWVWTERSTWNPVGGIGDLYTSDIWRNLYDAPIQNQPFTGVTQPFRAGFKVDTAGPSGKLDIPNDAVLWDASTGQWKTVAASSKAISKVTFDYSKYFSSKWHDGQSINMADVLYSIAQGYELAYNPDKSKIEIAIAATSRPLLETFKGFRVVDANKLEVYVDFWHFDQSQIAGYASPSGLGTPWELLAAMDDLVFKQRRAAYSDTAAARFDLPWLSLVLDKDARAVVKTLRQFGSDGFVPAGVFTVGGKSLVSAADAKARYQAAIDWFNKYGHLVISQGPYFLAKYDPPAQYAELQAFRDPSYPFKPGDWYLGSPPSLNIAQVQAPKVSVGKAAEIKATVRGPGTVGLRYLLVSPADGKVLASGQSKTGKAGDLSVSLDANATKGLKAGLYKLYLAAYSDSLASVAERTVDLTVGQ